MTYAAGTISNANSASAFLAVLDATIVAETGLSKVSSAIVVGTRTWNVYKSAAAYNAKGADFYFALGYITATPTSLLMTVFEGWNAGTALATGYPPNAATIPDGAFANPGTALALPSTGTTMGHLQTGTITTAFSYYYSVTADRVVFSIRTSTPTDIGFYLGLYDPFNDASVDPFPLCAINLMGGSTNIATAPASLQGITTREPTQAGNASTSFSATTIGSATSAWTRVESIIDVYKGFYYLSRALLIGRTTAAYRGLLKDIYLGPPQTQNGDTVTWTLAGVNRTGVRAAGSTFGVYFLTA